MVEVRQIDWTTILDVWQNHLWIGRASPIEQTSAMTFEGDYDMSFMDESPTFFGVFVDGALAGVNSGHPAGVGRFRSRGLFVFPQFRGMALGRTLLQATVDYAKGCGYNMIWSIPRRDSFESYRSVGFEQFSDWFTDGVEFGPNCYAVCILKE